MAAKIREVYVCSSCGYTATKWNGKCPGCNEWNTLEERVQTVNTKGGVIQSASPFQTPAAGEAPVSINKVDTRDEIRYKTGVRELDRVLGGGIVKGALMLLSGDPGIGKSTLLLQICAYLGQDLKILYISGEESIRQIKLRADRLAVKSENLFLAAQTDMDTISGTILQYKPDVVMVDSIQTMTLASVVSSPGSITQVRECTNALIRIAKTEDIPIFIVGHVNKDGNIAGPKVLEHMVDAVLYFEGDRQMSYRILRAVKNRYGSTNEIGVFEMRDSGLEEVENPSMALISGRPTGVSGTCVACIMEGSRPIMAEVQALVTKTGFGNPRRVATGFDYNRMALIIAVLEKRVGYYFGNLDVYINAVGGLRLDEPAADLAIALALVSSLRDKPIDENILAFGEIGLTGEIRHVNHAESRIKEAQRLGFTKCIVPRQSLLKVQDSAQYAIGIKSADNIKQAFGYI